MTESTTESTPGSPPAPARRRRLPTWMWGAIGAAAVLVYGLAIERMRLGPPLVMLALGGMTLAFAAGALWRMIDPLTRAEAPGAAAGGGQSRGAARELEREKQLVLKAIKEIEHDYQMRKISERDYREMVERYRNRAMRLISEIDAGGNYRELIEKELKVRLELELRAAGTAAAPATTAAPAVTASTAVTAAARPKCAACQTENDPDAKFCKSCGGKL